MKALDAAQFVHGMEALGVYMAAMVDQDGKPNGWYRSVGIASEEEYQLLAWVNADQANNDAVVQYLIETCQFHVVARAA